MQTAKIQISLRILYAQESTTDHIAYHWHQQKEEQNMADSTKISVKKIAFGNKEHTTD